MRGTVFVRVRYEMICPDQVLSNNDPHRYFVAVKYQSRPTVRCFTRIWSKKTSFTLLPHFAYINTPSTANKIMSFMRTYSLHMSTKFHINGRSCFWKRRARQQIDGQQTDFIIIFRKGFVVFLCLGSQLCRLLNQITYINVMLTFKYVHMLS